MADDESGKDDASSTPAISSTPHLQAPSIVPSLYVEPPSQQSSMDTIRPAAKRLSDPPRRKSEAIRPEEAKDSGLSPPASPPMDRRPARSSSSFSWQAVASSPSKLWQKTTITRTISDYTIQSAQSTPGSDKLGDSDQMTVQTTAYTKGTLERLGYPDELVRDHDAFSLFSVCLANIGFLQGALFAVIGSSVRGGSSMLGWGWPIGGVLMCIFSASLAEFGSAFPVSGGMFTWVWKLCRASPTLKGSARYLSWICGSFLLCGHILAQVLLAYQFAVALQGTILVYAPEYEPTTWRTIFFAWLELFCCGVLASFPISRSPRLWKAIGLEIIATALLMSIALLASEDAKVSGSTIYTAFENKTGFDSSGYVYLLGWVSTCIVTGQDVAFHLAEEAKRPSHTVPIACFWSVAVSYMVGYLCIGALLASSPSSKLDSEAAAYFSPGETLVSTLQRPLAFAILILILIAMFSQGVAQLLASSRFAWALARDKALPFSNVIKRVSKKRIPYVAVWSVVLIVIPCLLLIDINVGMVQTLILDATGISLILAYVLPCFIYLFCPGTEAIEEGGWRWTLRTLSKPAAAVACVYAFFIIALFCFPTSNPVRAISFPWGPILAILALILATLTWVFYGNAHYAGPIKILLGPSVELPRYSTLKSNSRKHQQTPSEAYGKTAQVLYKSQASKQSTQATTVTTATDSGWTTDGESNDSGISSMGSSSSVGTIMQQDGRDGTGSVSAHPS